MVLQTLLANRYYVFSDSRNKFKIHDFVFVKNVLFLLPVQSKYLGQDFSNNFARRPRGPHGLQTNLKFRRRVAKF